MCPFNANQTRGWKRPGLQLPASSDWPAMKNSPGGVGVFGGTAMCVISGFEGIKARSLLLAWPRLTPDRPRHNKRAKGVKAERRQIKTEPQMCVSAANLGFPLRISCLSILCGQIIGFPVLGLRQQMSICCSFCDKEEFNVVAAVRSFDCQLGWNLLHLNAKSLL